MSNRIHAIGPHEIGGQHKTACNSFMAEGLYAVSVTDDPEKVTCLACKKALTR